MSHVSVAMVPRVNVVMVPCVSVAMVPSVSLPWFPMSVLPWFPVSVLPWFLGINDCELELISNVRVGHINKLNFDTCYRNDNVRSVN